MFFKKLRSLQEADLLFIMGTSLTVYPFASLCDLVPKECPRVLVNFDEVGDIGERHNDILLLGDCDEMLTNLCKALDWDADLKMVWEAAKDSVGGVVDTEEQGTPISTPREVDNPPAKEDTVKDLAEQVELALKLTDEIDPTHESDEVVAAEKSPKLDKGGADNGKDNT
jgi:NAD-dependent histone deacetylase SIR2